MVVVPSLGVREVCIGGLGLAVSAGVLFLPDPAGAGMREAGKKITQSCPFANAEFRRHPEWADVLRQ